MGARAGDPHHTDRIPGGRRSARHRPRRKPSPARRQSHRFHADRIQRGREGWNCSRRSRQASRE